MEHRRSRGLVAGIGYTASMVDANELRSRVGEAAQNTGARVAFLFGSQVTGNTWAESDVDIAIRWPVDFNDEARWKARLELLAALTDALGHLGERVDIVDLDRADSAVGFRAIRDGECVYAATRDEEVRAVVDVSRRYDDDTPRRELFRYAAIRAVQRLPEPSGG
jgi:predicted nucleotidyltransferase